jgi:hypothetical protein
MGRLTPALSLGGRSARQAEQEFRRSTAPTPCDHGFVHARVDELQRLLNEWDFIGVFDPETNTDEYDCMITPLLTRLSGGAGTRQVQQFLDDEITGHLGMSRGQVETGAMAERLTAWSRSVAL